MLAPRRRAVLSLVTALLLAWAGLTVLTVSSAQAAVTDIRINEVESNGGTPGDWIELTNIGSTTQDIGGMGLLDNDNTHTIYHVPAGTMLAPGGFYVADVAAFVFGLGAPDSVRLYAPGAVATDTPVDSYSWTTHATGTYGRCPDGTGAFVDAASTKGAANTCPSIHDIRINEVESNGGTPGDWIELTNIGSATQDIGGMGLLDNDNTHTIYHVPAGTMLAPGGFYVAEVADFVFGLGAPDSVRLYLPGAVATDTPLDSYSWTTHAVGTYGRCPDGTGAFVDATSTKGAANSCSVAPPNAVKINEIQNQGTPGDWVELVNTSNAPVNIAGYVLKHTADANTFTVPAATTIAANGYFTADVEPGMSLTSSDAVTLYAADGTTQLDSFGWISNTATTYGRCPDTTGSIVKTTGPTKNAANTCISPSAWPGSPNVSTVDTAGFFGTNLSGLIYQGTNSSTPGTLWGVRNGPSTLYKLVNSGSSWIADAGDWANGKSLKYPGGTGDPDAEGVTFTDAGPAAGVFVSTERDNNNNGVSRPAILEFLPDTAGTTLTAVHDWNLTPDLPNLGPNLGLEAIAWVPDSYLTAKGFQDQHLSKTYSPGDYPDHGNGLFLVGVENTGNVYAYALDLTSNSFQQVASFDSGFPAVMDLNYEPETQQLWVACDDTCQGQTARFDINGAGAFAPVSYYSRPTGMPNYNNEGFAVANQGECVGGLKPAWWSDDNADDSHALREGMVSCTLPVAQTVQFTTTAPANPRVADHYTPAASGGGSGNPVVISIDAASSAVCSISAGQVTFDHTGSCVIDATQAGDDTHGPGSAQQTVQVATADQTVTFSTSPPSGDVVGQTYHPAATGGASNNPVVVTVDAASAAVCAISSGTVTFNHAGSCVIDANQAGNADFGAGSAQQTVTVVRANTTTLAGVHATTLTALVTVLAPGVGTPGGAVNFVVDGTVVGSANLAGGVASLTYTVPHDGATHSVQAAYQGSTDFVSSAGSATRKDPTVTAAVSSGHDPSPFGWYAGPVTVTFTCTAGSAPLVDSCPSPVTLDGSAADQSVSRTVTATDGGSTAVTVGDLDIDTDAPAVAIAGIKDGATYAHEKHPRCRGSDALSGIDSCTIDQVQHGRKVKVTATATDRAGNVATSTATYKVRKKQH